MDKKIALNLLGFVESENPDTVKIHQAYLRLIRDNFHIMRRAERSDDPEATRKVQEWNAARDFLNKSDDESDFFSDFDQPLPETAFFINADGFIKINSAFKRQRFELSEFSFQNFQLIEIELIQYMVRILLHNFNERLDVLDSKLGILLGQKNFTTRAVEETESEKQAKSEIFRDTYKKLWQKGFKLLIRFKRSKIQMELFSMHWHNSILEVELSFVFDGNKQRKKCNLVTGQWQISSYQDQLSMIEELLKLGSKYPELAQGLVQNEALWPYFLAHEEQLVELLCGKAPQLEQFILGVWIFDDWCRAMPETYHRFSTLFAEPLQQVREGLLKASKRAESDPKGARFAWFVHNMMLPMHRDRCIEEVLDRLAKALNQPLTQGEALVKGAIVLDASIPRFWEITDAVRAEDEERVHKNRVGYGTHADVCIGHAYLPDQIHGGKKELGVYVQNHLEELLRYLEQDKAQAFAWLKDISCVAFGAGVLIEWRVAGEHGEQAIRVWLSEQHYAETQLNRILKIGTDKLAWDEAKIAGLDRAIAVIRDRWNPIADDIHGIGQVSEPDVVEKQVFEDEPEPWYEEENEADDEYATDEEEQETTPPCIDINPSLGNKTIDIDEVLRDRGQTDTQSEPDNLVWQLSTGASWAWMILSLFSLSLVYWGLKAYAHVNNLEIKWHFLSTNTRDSGKADLVHQNSVNSDNYAIKVIGVQGAAQLSNADPDDTQYEGNQNPAPALIKSTHMSRVDGNNRFPQYHSPIL